MRPTGSAIIDRMIGGFPDGSPLVVSGPAGSGRTALAIELAHHALARGEPVSFLTTESAASLLHRAASLGFPFDGPLEADRLAILELHAGAPALLREHGIAALVAALRGETAGRSLVVIDSVSALLAEIADADRLRALARELLRSLAGDDLVLTLEEDRPGHRPLEAAVGELAGAFLRLDCEPSGRRTIRVEKTRSGVGASPRVEIGIGPGGVRGASEAARRPRILVADDDRLLRARIGEWLGARYEVIAVADGFEALAALVSKQPDLVVLDLVMPRVSGYEFLFSMRRSGFEAPVLVASSQVATQGARLGPLVLGATDFLAKPFSRLELIHKVETLLRLPHAPSSCFGEAEAETLFGSFSCSRRLEIGEFAARVAGACAFGEKYEVSSSLVALVAARERDLDRWVEAADRALRFEDAVVRPDKRLAIALLVATAPQHAPEVVERIAAHAEGGAPLPKLATEIWPAERRLASPEALADLTYELLGGADAT